MPSFAPKVMFRQFPHKSSFFGVCGCIPRNSHADIRSERGLRKSESYFYRDMLHRKRRIFPLTRECNKIFIILLARAHHNYSVRAFQVVLKICCIFRISGSNVSKMK